MRTRLHPKTLFTTVTLRWLLMFGLALAALVNVGLALALLARPDEIRYGEAILYGQAGRLLHGEALYQSPDVAPYTVSAYTPVYYWLVAQLRGAFGPGFLPGRSVSLAAGLVASGLVGQLTWRRTRAVWPVLGACLLFLGCGLTVPWLAAYKEDVLGVAFALGSLSVLDGGATRVRVVLSATLAALAILTKQTLFGPAVIGAAWLAVTHREQAVLFAGVAFGLVAVVAADLEATTHAFFASTVLANLNPFNLEVLHYELILLAVFQLGPLLVASAYLVPRLRPKRIAQDLLVGAWVVSLIPMLGMAKEGADYNYWELFAGMSAVVVMTALWDQRHSRWFALGSVVLGSNLAVVIAVLGTVAVAQARLVQAGPAADRAFEHLVATARAAPGAVLSDPLDISVLADRPVVLEPVIYNLFYRAGRWDATSVVRSVCSGEVSLVILGYPLESSPGVTGFADTQWPPPVLEAMRHTLVLLDVITAGQGQRFIYVPAHSCPAGSSPMHVPPVG